MAHSDVNPVPSQSLLSLPHRCECLALGCFWLGAQALGAAGGGGGEGGRWLAEWVCGCVGGVFACFKSKQRWAR